MIKNTQIKGYILPVAMSIMSVLTFTMLGVTETSQVNEKRARNEQNRRLVEQVSRSELEYQTKFIEANPELLRKSSNTTLSPITFKSGCTSTSKEAICQTVNLIYLRSIPKPVALQTKIPLSEFTGRRFKLTSGAINENSGASSETSIEMSSVQLDIPARQEISFSLYKDLDRDKLIGELGYYIPEWWDVKITLPWRIGCVAPDFSFNLTSLLGGIWGGLEEALRGNIAIIADCIVTYTDRRGIRREWISEDINPGDKVSFIVPAGSSNVGHYWRGWVYASTADNDNFWDNLNPFPSRWRFRQYSWSLPQPRDICHVMTGTIYSVTATPCPFELLDGITPIVGP